MEQPVRVLIADDQPRTRQSLKALLGTCPEIDVVSEADNGREAVVRVEAYRPDVVLMDVQMPILDGLAATRLIKQQWPWVRVVVLTLYATYRGAALAAGADAFMLKGGAVEELWDAILTPDLTRRKTSCYSD